MRNIGIFKDHNSKTKCDRSKQKTGFYMSRCWQNRQKKLDLWKPIFNKHNFS